MKWLKSAETSLEDIFLKQAPSLPANAKKVIVEWLPWINLVVALLTLWSVWNLWDWAHRINKGIEIINQSSSNLLTGAPQVSKLSFGIWIGLLIMTVEAAIYLMAFSALRARQKRGWDLLFLGLFINLLYGLVIMFTSYGGFGNFIGSLLGSTVGFYFMFQIRDLYLKKTVVVNSEVITAQKLPTKTTSKPKKTKSSKKTSAKKKSSSTKKAKKAKSD